MKVLIIEDDQHTSNLLSATLCANRYAVDAIADGLSGLDLAAQWSYDVILLDILLPNLNGIEVCRRLRAQGCQTPILILTMKDSNEDIIAGLDAGADDYVAKSCASSQLLARVRALLRRGRSASSTPVLTWGLLRLDPSSAQVTYNHEVILLRPKEYNLLELFLRHPQRIFNRSAIIDHLWSIDEPPVEGSVTNLIKDLRQRLKSTGIDAGLIETVYGLGYRLKTDPAKGGGAERLESAKIIEEHKTTSEHISLTDWGNDWEVRKQRGMTAIQQITERFWGSLEQRIIELEATERSLQTNGFSLQKRKAARHEMHKLAGGLGTFGCVKASEVAQAMECLLEVKVSQETCLANQFSQLLKELKQELALRT